MRGWRWLSLALILVLVILATTACNVNSSQAQQQLVSVTKGDLVIKANGSGKVGVDTDAKPSFGSGGKIVTLNVKEGDKVTKGTVLAQLETDNLELALSQTKVAESQAKVALTQAEVGLSQAQIALAQAQSTQTQAESSVAVAQFALDKVQAVADIKDKMVELQLQIQTCDMFVKDANVRNDMDGAQYWKTEKLNYQTDLLKNQNKLAELLAKDEFTGVATYEIQGQKYDRLVVVDVRMKQLQLQSAQQSVEQAKQNVELNKQYMERASQNIDLAKRSLEQASKALEVSRTQLTNATILAPIDGTVLDLNVKEGDTLTVYSTGIPVYMIDTNSIQVSALIDEIDITNVKAGQNVIINLDSASEVKYEGRVKSISMSPVANPQNSGVVVYEVKVGFVNPPPPEVKLGMSSTVDIITNQRQGVLLAPNRAIKEDDQGNSFVDVMVDKKVESRSIKLGISDGVNTEIVSGLNAGDIVVITRTNQNQGLFGQ
jgi:RND family efflux transporter MFP subunit